MVGGRRDGGSADLGSLRDDQDIGCVMPLQYTTLVWEDWLDCENYLISVVCKLDC